MDINNIENISKFSKLLFKIKYENNEGIIFGTGFFIIFSTLTEYELMYGIMKNNHVFDTKYLVQNFNFLIRFNNKKKIKIKLDKSYFIFTSELLDMTFIQFNNNLIKKLKLNKDSFLIPCNGNDISDKYYVFQYFRSGKCKLGDGKILYEKFLNDFIIFIQLSQIMDP